MLCRKWEARVAASAIWWMERGLYHICSLEVDQAESAPHYSHCVALQLLVSPAGPRERKKKKRHPFVRSSELNLCQVLFCSLTKFWPMGFAIAIAAAAAAAAAVVDLHTSPYSILHSTKTSRAS